MVESERGPGRRPLALPPPATGDDVSFQGTVSRISLKSWCLNSRCDHEQELSTSLLFALGQTHPPARHCIDSGRRTKRSRGFFYVPSIFFFPQPLLSDTG